MIPSSKEMVTSHKIFFHIFSENVAFIEKIIRWKNIQNFISHKEGYIHFRRQTLLPLRDLAPRKRFLLFS